MGYCQEFVRLEFKDPIKVDNQQTRDGISNHNATQARSEEKKISINTGGIILVAAAAIFILIAVLVS